METYKFQVLDCSQLVTFDYAVTFKPKDFLYCETLEELFEELEDRIYNSYPYFDECSKSKPETLKFWEAKSLGEHIQWNFEFVEEWQRLKQLEKEKE